MNALKIALASAVLSVLPGMASAASLGLLNFAGSDYSTHLVGGSFSLSSLGLSGKTLDVIADVKKDGDNGLYVDGPAKVTYTYLGKEAAFTNNFKFSIPGANVFTTSTPVGTTSGPFNAIAGALLPFILTSEGDGHFVFNSAGATTAMNIAYYIFNNAKSAFVLLDDFGAGPDSDFDDIAIRVDIAPVPLPPAGLLLISALGGLGLLGRRRRVRI